MIKYHMGPRVPSEAAEDRTLSRIDRVESWAVRVPLERPLRLGALDVRVRDFVVVRITTADGHTGVAYSLSRGAPVDIVIGELLAPVVLGGDARDVAERIAACRRANLSLGDVGIVGQGLSLLDICLWDIKARAAGLPLWRLLGGLPTHAPVMLVAPYANEGESDEAYAYRIEGFVHKGYRMLKLYPTPWPRDMSRRLAAVRKVIGDDVRLVVDLGWLWQRAADAIQVARDWEPFGLEWIEDPMPADLVDEIGALSRAVATPVAVGDEVTVPLYIERLLETGAVDVLRLDAATIGGISTFRRLHGLAAAMHRRISPHVYPEFHRHCVFAWPDVGPVETFPVPCETWGSHLFVVGDAAAIDLEGRTRAPGEPGLGFEIDWQMVRSLSRRYLDVRPDPGS